MNLNQIENDGKRNLRRLQNVASGTENGETNRENGCCSQNEKAMISTPREQCIHTEGVPDSIPASPTIFDCSPTFPAWRASRQRRLAVVHLRCGSHTAGHPGLSS
jgi:hypothetical protein